MGKTGAILAAAAVAILAYCAAAQTAAPPPSVQVGRYQLVGPLEVNGRVLAVIDTATGQCWSKAKRGEWRDEGNPTRRRDAATARDGEPAATLRLDQPVDLTIMQRQEKAIPGSDDAVLFRLGDITEGQVLLSVVTNDGKTLMDSVSLQTGGEARFKLNGTEYMIRVRELRNVLVGGDFARITVERASRKAEAPRDDDAREPRKD